MKCLYCGGHDFFEGPSGGMSTNVLCANPDCRHWFNHTPMLNRLDDLNRIEPTDAERAEAQERRRREEEARPSVLHSEGASLYAAGKPATACISDRAYGGYALAEDNAYRLAGWMDTMHYELVEVRRKMGLRRL